MPDQAAPAGLGGVGNDSAARSLPTSNGILLASWAPHDGHEVRPGGLLATMLSAPACSSDPDDRGGDDAPPIDDGEDTDDGSAGGDGGGDGDDGGGPAPVGPEPCEGAVVEAVTSTPSPLAGDSSLAVTPAGPCSSPSPDFAGACVVPVEPDGDEGSPEAVVDPTTGDVHILVRIVEEDGVGLAHARLPAPSSTSR